MSSRRAFLTRVAALAGTAAATSFAIKMPSATAMTARKRLRIKSLIRREDTIQRFSGVGDCWHSSWAADDRLYVSLCDGFGFSGQSHYLYNCNMVAVEGGPHDAKFSELPTYPLLSYASSQKLGDPRYYPFGTLALDGRLYQYLSTFDRGLVPQDIGTVVDDRTKVPKPLRFIGAKLIYSPDNGQTWCNQDGSTPVVWDRWEQRSRETLVFFEEPQDSFSMISMLQMGQNYAHNRDGFVYGYAPNGSVDGTMNELVMFRVPKERILERAAYEYFAGATAAGEPKWNKDIDARRPVHTFPRGWVNAILHPYAWLPSVVYNAPLGVYMMTSWGMGTGPEGRWFSKPSYLGFWTSQQPWGPWTQIHEETAWMPNGEGKALAFQPQISPKWIAPDGKSFWLVWTDSQLKGDQAEYKRLSALLSGKHVDEYTRADWALRYELFRKFNPYYSFNTQRVDLQSKS